jgi:hypothetical protein
MKSSISRSAAYLFTMRESANAKIARWRYRRLNSGAHTLGGPGEVAVKWIVWSWIT